MYAKASCRAYIVDPTLDIVSASVAELSSRESARHFATRLAAYGATLNASVGVGKPNSTGTLHFKGETTRKHFPLVSLSRLLSDRYGPSPWHLSVLKMDIEGHERSVLTELFGLCASGALAVEQMNVEVHPWPQWYGQTTYRTVRELHALFSGALSCGLVLHHKERNLWGCPAGQCMELSWVSLRHARRVALATVSQSQSLAQSAGMGVAVERHHHSH